MQLSHDSDRPANKVYDLIATDKWLCKGSKSGKIFEVIKTLAIIAIYPVVFKQRKDSSVLWLRPDGNVEIIVRRVESEAKDTKGQ
jgi:hypothetical protein